MGLARGERWLFGVTVILTAAAALCHFAPTGRIVPFVVSALALAAEAALIGRAVEGLGTRFGSGATGVLQSALGNIPELLFGIFALRRGLVVVVQATLVGSILSNVLVVLGLAVLVGGLRHGTQRFAAQGARMVSLLLLLSVSIWIIPTGTAFLHAPVASHERALSDIASVVLLMIFAMAVPSSLRRAQGEDAVPDGGDGHPWPLSIALFVLVASGVAAAAVSDWFVAALTPALSALHISQAFAGLVIVAIAGNAVENVVGIQLASRNRMDYAMSVIMQSPLQVALVVLPVLVLLSGAIGGAHLTMVFPPLEIVSLALTAIIGVVVVTDGESTWLEGACLIGLYTVLAAAFWWG